MADKRISELTTLTGANSADDDLLVIVDSSASETKSITLGELEKALGERDFSFADNDKLVFGDGDDLQIYHDSATSTNKVVGSIDVTGTVTADENITIDTSSSGNGLTIQSSGNTYNRLTFDANRSASGNLLGEIMGEWNGTQVAAIRVSAGSDTTNKDDGQIYFLTSSDGTGNKNRVNIANNGDISFYEDTGTTAKFFWDASAEGLNIGASSAPFGKLDISDVGGTGVSTIFDAASGDNYITSGASGIVQFRRGSTNTVRIDGAGNVGIGITPEPTWITGYAGRVLQIGDAAVFGGSTNDSMSYMLANAYYDSGNSRWEYINTDFATRYEQLDGQHVFYTASSGTADAAITWSQAMTLDASGNLLVGKTTAGNVSINGCELSSSGFGSFSRDGNTPGYFNRDTSDGTIIDLRKDGVTVGSIGTIGGYTYFTGESRGLAVRNSGIYPCDTSGIGVNGTLDIGTSGARFKDLYLSGGIKAGSNNLLRFADSGAGRVMIGSSTEGDTSGITAFIRGSASATTSYFLWNRTDTALSGAAAVFQNANTTVGTIQYTNTATSYNTSSDYRLKENVVDMAGAVDRVKALNPSQFNFIADPDTTVDGFLAHEVADVVPEAVTGTKDAMRTEEYEVTPAVLDDDGNVVTEAVMGTREVPDYQGIDQSKLVPLLTGALQEAIARIETLEAEVATLKGN